MGWKHNFSGRLLASMHEAWVQSPAPPLQPQLQDIMECILHFECYLLMATRFQVDTVLGNIIQKM